MPVIPLGQALHSGAAEALQRRVEVSGHYDAAKQVVLLFRSLDSEPGSDVLTPLVTADGTAVIANRGWVPSSDPGQQPLPAAAAPPSGPVQVVGLVVPGESVGAEPSRVPGAPLTEVTRIDLGLLQRNEPYRLYPVVLQLLKQDPAQATGSPQPLPPAPLDSGPYFSYAIQWWLFTAVGLVGWPLLIRRSARERSRQARQEESGVEHAEAASRA